MVYTFLPRPAQANLVIFIIFTDVLVPLDGALRRGGAHLGGRAIP